MNNKKHKDPPMIVGGAAQVVHSREVAALMESMGYTDQSARKWGFQDVFSMAEDLFALLQQKLVPDMKHSQRGQRLSFWAETGCAMRKFSLSFAYAIPWMVMLALEYFRPDALLVSPQVGGVLSLSLIASLVTTGGFVQMISRCGNFYFGMKEPALAHRACISLLDIGLTSSLFLTLLGMIAGSYYHLFASNYLILAAINYVAMSLLWMLCAMLSVQGIGWCIPFIFLLSILAGALINALLSPGTVVLLILCPLMAVLGALGCVLAGSYHAERKYPQNTDSARPRGDVMFLSLVPFYVYGTVYFSFLFADRLTAGTAVPWVSGLTFGIDAAYKSGTDLVLLAFLITAALAECLADSFLRFWQRLAMELPQGANDQLQASLWRRHSKLMLATFVAFSVIALGAWYVFYLLGGHVPPPRFLQTVLIGGLGYLLLSMALLEIIILATVGAISTASLALALGVAVNLLTGYVLSHLLGVQYAAVGLLFGSAVVLTLCNAAVRQVLRQPDYHYSVS